MSKLAGDDVEFGGISSQQTVHRGLLEDVLLRDLRVRQAPDLGDRRSSVIGCVETPASASFLRSRSMASSTADFGAESLDTSSAYPSLGFGGRLVEVREPCGRRPMRRAVL